MDKTIVVTIDKKGNAHIEANNFHGIGCSALVEAMSSALGQTINEGHKSELYEEDECAVITNYQD
jgi:hypothetical protein